MTTHAQLLTLDTTLNPAVFQSTYRRVIGEYATDLARTAASLLKAGLAAHAPALQADLERLTLLALRGNGLKAVLMKKTIGRAIPEAEYSGWPLPEEALEAQLQAALNVRLHLLKLREGNGTVSRDAFAVYSAVPVSALANLVLPARGDTRPLNVSLRAALAEVLRLYDLPDLASRVMDLPENQDVRDTFSGHAYTLDDCLDFTPDLGRTLLDLLARLLAEVSELNLDPEARGLRSVTAGNFRFCALHDGWLVTRHGEAIGLYPSALALLCTAKTEFGLLHDPVSLPATLEGETLEFGEQAPPLSVRRLHAHPDGIVDMMTGRSYHLDPQTLERVRAQQLTTG